MRLLTLLIILSQTAFAALPPTSLKGQTETSPKTKLFFQVPHSQATDLGGITGLIETGNKNLLSNPGFEATVTGWTASGGSSISVDSNAANLATGKQSAAFSLLASGTATGPSISIPNGLKGKNAEFSCAVKTTSTTLKLQMYDGSNVIVESDATVNSSDLQNIRINFVAPSSGSMQLRLSAGASAATGNIDDCYVGEATNIGNVSQAQFVGSLNYAAATNCQWSRSSATFGNFSADTDCATPTVTGSASAPATKIPGITFTALPPGRYKFKAIGSFFDGVDNSEECYYRFSDGTNNMQSNGIGAAVTVSPLVEGEIEYSTAQSNITIQIQARAGVSQACDIYAAREGFYITVERIPTSSQQAVTTDTQAMSWSGYTGGCSANPTVTSASLADFSSTGCSITETTNTNFSSVSAGSGLSISFTPRKMGTYLIKANLPAVNDSAGTNTKSFVMTDSSNNILDGFSVVPSGGSAGVSFVGLYNVTSLTSQTIKIRASVPSGTITVSPLSSRNAVWSIVDISQNLPAPLLVGSVTSNSSGAERIERARIANNGTCSVTSQSGSWISSIVNSSTGKCAISFGASIFSAAPTCICTLVGTATTICSLDAEPTTGGVTTSTYSTGSSAFTNQPYHITCMGPK